MATAVTRHERMVGLSPQDRMQENYLDLNTDRFAEPGMLESVLNTLFVRWEEKYGITDIEESYSQRFKNIIRSAHGWAIERT